MTERHLSSPKGTFRDRQSCGNKFPYQLIQQAEVLQTRKRNPRVIVPEFLRLRLKKAVFTNITKKIGSRKVCFILRISIKVSVIHLLIFLFSLQFANTSQHSFQSVHKACLKTGSFKILQEHGIVYFTGYLFGKPLSLQKFGFCYSAKFRPKLLQHQKTSYSCFRRGKYICC